MHCVCMMAKGVCMLLALPLTATWIRSICIVRSMACWNSRHRRPPLRNKRRLLYLVKIFGLRWVIFSVSTVTLGGGPWLALTAGQRSWRLSGLTSTRSIRTRPVRQI